jgi:hypothetical protein
MGYWFGQFDGTVHRGYWPGFDLHPDQLFAISTATAFELLESHFPSSFLLDGTAESLPHGVSRQLDLVIVGHSIPLIDGLKLGCDLRGLLQMKFEFFLELCFSRVHANSPKNKVLQYLPQPSRLSYHYIPQNSYCTFSPFLGLCKS